MKTVICIDDRNTWLTCGAIYNVLEESNDSLTVEDSKGNVGVFDKDRFRPSCINDYVVTLDTSKPLAIDITELKTRKEKENKDTKETLYHITYSMNYAMGIKLEECHDIVKIIGNIVTPITKLYGQIAVDTSRGLVIIPFNSIVHMHPQY